MKRRSLIWLLLPVLWLAACSPIVNVTVHDEDAAALIASNFLHTAFYQHKPGDAYDITHPLFKTRVSRADFAAAIQKVQSSNSPTNLVITDFSTWGTQETLGIYGNSQTSAGVVLHFRCLLTGTKTKGYAVTRLDFNTTLPKKTGMNVPFKIPIRLSQ